MRNSLTLVIGPALLGFTWCASALRETSEDELTGDELKRLERLAMDPKADPAQVWDGLVAVRQRAPGSRHAVTANQLLLRVRSPLDRLQPEGIPSAGRFAWQPRELVAVLGEHSARHWGRLV